MPINRANNPCARGGRQSPPHYCHHASPQGHTTTNSTPPPPALAFAAAGYMHGNPSEGTQERQHRSPPPSFPSYHAPAVHCFTHNYSYSHTYNHNHNHTHALSPIPSQDGYTAEVETAPPPSLPPVTTALSGASPFLPSLFEEIYEKSNRANSVTSSSASTAARNHHHHNCQTQSRSTQHDPHDQRTPLPITLSPRGRGEEGPAVRSPPPPPPPPHPTVICPPPLPSAYAYVPHEAAQHVHQYPYTHSNHQQYSAAVPHTASFTTGPPNVCIGVSGTHDAMPVTTKKKRHRKHHNNSRKKKAADPEFHSNPNQEGSEEIITARHARNPHGDEKQEESQEDSTPQCCPFPHSHDPPPYQPPLPSCLLATHSSTVCGVHCAKSHTSPHPHSHPPPRPMRRTPTAYSIKTNSSDSGGDDTDSGEDEEEEEREVSKAGIGKEREEERVRGRGTNTRDKKQRTPTLLLHSVKRHDKGSGAAVRGPSDSSSNGNHRNNRDNYHGNTGHTNNNTTVDNQNDNNNNHNQFLVGGCSYSVRSECGSSTHPLHDDDPYAGDTDDEEKEHNDNRNHYGLVGEPQSQVNQRENDDNADAAEDSESVGCSVPKLKPLAATESGELSPSPNLIPIRNLFRITNAAGAAGTVGGGGGSNTQNNNHNNSTASTSSGSALLTAAFMTAANIHKRALLSSGNYNFSNLNYNLNNSSSNNNNNGNYMYTGGSGGGDFVMAPHMDGTATEEDFYTFSNSSINNSLIIDRSSRVDGTTARAANAFSILGNRMPYPTAAERGSRLSPPPPPPPPPSPPPLLPPPYMSRIPAPFMLQSDVLGRGSSAKGGREGEEGVVEAPQQPHAFRFRGYGINAKNNYLATRQDAPNNTANSTHTASNSNSKSTHLNKGNTKRAKAQTVAAENKKKDHWGGMRCPTTAGSSSSSNKKNNHDDEEFTYSSYNNYRLTHTPPNTPVSATMLLLPPPTCTAANTANTIPLTRPTTRMLVRGSAVDMTLNLQQQQSVLLLPPPPPPTAASASTLVTLSGNNNTTTTNGAGLDDHNKNGGNTNQMTNELLIIIKEDVEEEEEKDEELQENTNEGINTVETEACGDSKNNNVRCGEKNRNVGLGSDEKDGERVEGRGGEVKTDAEGVVTDNTSTGLRTLCMVGDSYHHHDAHEEDSASHTVFMSKAQEKNKLRRQKQRTKRHFGRLAAHLLGEIDTLAALEAHNNSNLNNNHNDENNENSQHDTNENNQNDNCLVAQGKEDDERLRKELSAAGKGVECPTKRSGGGIVCTTRPLRREESERNGKGVVVGVGSSGACEDDEEKTEISPVVANVSSSGVESNIKEELLLKTEAAPQEAEKSRAARKKAETTDRASSDANAHSNNDGGGDDNCLYRYIHHYDDERQISEELMRAHIAAAEELLLSTETPLPEGLELEEKKGKEERRETREGHRELRVLFSPVSNSCRDGEPLSALVQQQLSTLLSEKEDVEQNACNSARSSPFLPLSKAPPTSHRQEKRSDEVTSENKRGNGDKTGGEGIGGDSLNTIKMFRPPTFHARGSLSSLAVAAGTSTTTLMMKSLASPLLPSHTAATSGGCVQKEQDIKTSDCSGGFIAAEQPNEEREEKKQHERDGTRLLHVEDDRCDDTMKKKKTRGFLLQQGDNACTPPHSHSHSHSHHNSNHHPSLLTPSPAPQRRTSMVTFLSSNEFDNASATTAAVTHSSNNGKNNTDNYVNFINKNGDQSPAHVPDVFEEEEAVNEGEEDEERGEEEQQFSLIEADEGSSFLATPTPRMTTMGTSFPSLSTTAGASFLQQRQQQETCHRTSSNKKIQKQEQQQLQQRQNFSSDSSGTSWTHPKSTSMRVEGANKEGFCFSHQNDPRYSTTNDSWVVAESVLDQQSIEKDDKGEAVHLHKDKHRLHSSSPDCSPYGPLRDMTRTNSFTDVKCSVGGRSRRRERGTQRGTTPNEVGGDNCKIEKKKKSFAGQFPLVPPQRPFTVKDLCPRACTTTNISAAAAGAGDKSTLSGPNTPTTGQSDLFAASSSFTYYTYTEESSPAASPLLLLNRTPSSTIHIRREGGKKVQDHQREGRAAPAAFSLRRRGGYNTTTTAAHVEGANLCGRVEEAEEEEEAIHNHGGGGEDYALYRGGNLRSHQNDHHHGTCSKLSPHLYLSLSLNSSRRRTPRGKAGKSSTKRTASSPSLLFPSRHSARTHTNATADAFTMVAVGKGMRVVASPTNTKAKEEAKSEMVRSSSSSSPSSASSSPLSDDNNPTRRRLKLLGVDLPLHAPHCAHFTLGGGGVTNDVSEDASPSPWSVKAQVSGQSAVKTHTSPFPFVSPTSPLLASHHKNSNCSSALLAPNEAALRSGERKEETEGNANHNDSDANGRRHDNRGVGPDPVAYGLLSEENMHTPLLPPPLAAAAGGAKVTKYFDTLSNTYYEYSYGLHHHHHAHANHDYGDVDEKVDTCHALRLAGNAHGYIIAAAAAANTCTTSSEGQQEQEEESKKYSASYSYFGGVHKENSRATSTSSIGDGDEKEETDALSVGDEVFSSQTATATETAPYASHAFSTDTAATTACPLTSLPVVVNSGGVPFCGVVGEDRKEGETSKKRRVPPTTLSSEPMINVSELRTMPCAEMNLEILKEKKEGEAEKRRNEKSLLERACRTCSSHHCPALSTTALFLLSELVRSEQAAIAATATTDAEGNQDDDNLTFTTKKNEKEGNKRMRNKTIAMNIAATPQPSSSQPLTSTPSQSSHLSKVTCPMCLHPIVIGPPAARTVHIKFLPPYMSEAQLWEDLLRPFGPVLKLRIDSNIPRNTTKQQINSSKKVHTSSVGSIGEQQASRAAFSFSPLRHRDPPREGFVSKWAYAIVELSTPHHAEYMISVLNGAAIVPQDPIGLLLRRATDDDNGSHHSASSQALRQGDRTPQQQRDEEDKEEVGSGSSDVETKEEATSMPAGLAHRLPIQYAVFSRNSVGLDRQRAAFEKCRADFWVDFNRIVTPTMSSDAPSTNAFSDLIRMPPFLNGRLQEGNDYISCATNSQYASLFDSHHRHDQDHHHHHQPTFVCCHGYHFYCCCCSLFALNRAFTPVFPIAPLVLRNASHHFNSMLSSSSVDGVETAATTVTSTIRPTDMPSTTKNTENKSNNESLLPFACAVYQLRLSATMASRPLYDEEPVNNNALRTTTTTSTNVHGVLRLGGERAWRSGHERACSRRDDKDKDDDNDNGTSLVEESTCTCCKSHTEGWVGATSQQLAAVLEWALRGHPEHISIAALILRNRLLRELSSK